MRYITPMTATKESDILLEAAALRKEYPRVVALDHLDLEVRAGEVVGLLGPNGAGKTTALRMFASILTPTSGRAAVCGFDTSTDALKAKQQLGFLSGDTALYKRMSPRETLRYFGRLHDMEDALIESRSAALIERLDMGDFVDRHCETLSTGQQQKANIARTLVHDPPVLILDEPTVSLDIVTGSFILETIRRARAEGKAVLFSTHIMSEAEYLCDRIVVIHKGRVCAAGTRDELRARTGAVSLAEAFLQLVGETVDIDTSSDNPEISCVGE
jgi:sodium transport system ATP-binding protein